MLQAVALMLGIIFLPVIFALIINVFNFSRINPSGSAVWFCIAVPLAPVLFIKNIRMDIYDSPWIYLIGENGKKKRYRKKRNSKEVRDIIEFIVEWFKPPLLWLSLVLIFLFCAMVCLTAFGYAE